MSKQMKLSASTRGVAGRSAVKDLRDEGLIPAVIYGAKEVPRNLQVKERELSALLAHAVGEHMLLDLEIEENGAKSSRLALLQEVQHNPVSGKVLHIDLLAVSQDEVIQSTVVVESFGVPAGVKTGGGLLEQLLREVEIECLPKDLPELIRVDVSELLVGQAIHIGQLPMPAGVKTLGDAEITVFHVAAPRVEAEVTEEAAVTQPEVIKEKKEAPAEGKESK